MCEQKAKKGRKRGGRPLNVKLILPKDEAALQRRISELHIEMINARIRRLGLSKEEVNEIKRQLLR